MNTKIKFVYKDVPYTLEYSRDAIRQMEQVGFSLTEFTKKPMSNLDTAFKGLFLKNHKRTNDKLVEEIYQNMSNKDALIEKILIMLSEAYDTLFDENDSNEGNIEWDVA